MIFLRSLIFNILFYGMTAIACILCIPTLLLPRAGILTIVRLYVGTTHLLEKYILGLDFEIRGKEHLPKEGPYIVAAKHQSAYETLKLHHLFKDPTIVLKKELLSIPIFGLFLKKIDVIAIDRSSREEAVKTLIGETQRMKEQNRPIVIFPQGTRVGIDVTPDKKPYKGGVVKMYKATDLPVIPLALNTGKFWPRNSFIKKSGTVVFEFLPPVEPGLPEDEVMDRLEKEIETHSNALLSLK